MPCLRMEFNFVLRGFSGVAHSWNVGGLSPLAVTDAAIVIPGGILKSTGATIGLTGGARLVVGCALIASEEVSGPADEKPRPPPWRLRACGVRRSGATIVVGNT